MCKVGVFNVSMLMNVFLQYIMFCDWGTIFCLEIANCKHVKTLIGNNSEKLPEIMMAERKTMHEPSKQWRPIITCWSLCKYQQEIFLYISVWKGDKYNYKNWQMQIQNLTYTRTKKWKVLQNIVFSCKDWTL